ncbi:hypothetical protein RJ640_010724 [Escallonia rubra]|uniref:Complex III subunit 9 n=1 Tax=Escallonia rubra TaxID=112253 RepID=A0AA88R064_9ASTE|nr:hypothetical protein RJ640_010724 [Escallonia rubra]
MAATAQSKGRIMEGFYRVIMRRTPVYVTFVIVGAFLGERAVDYGVHKLWEVNNIGIVRMLDKPRGLRIWEALTVHLKKVEVLDSEKAHFLDCVARSSCPLFQWRKPKTLGRNTPYYDLLNDTKCITETYMTCTAFLLGSTTLLVKRALLQRIRSIRTLGLTFEH